MNISEYYQSLNITDFEGYSQQDQGSTEFLQNIVNDSNITSVMEIGFNAGHSAELFLKNNLHAHLTSFDIGTHDYTLLGKQYIDKTYPNRHTLILGDSRITVPQFIKNNPTTKFDLIFIDGGHEDDIPKKDMTNCRYLAHKNTILILNDVKKTNINGYNIKPNEVWQEFKSKGFIQETAQHDFSPTHGLAYGKYNLCEIYICSLLTDERKPFIKANQELYPSIKVFKSVNGYDKEETNRELAKENLSYKKLGYGTYGTLANWITKYKMLKYQVDNEIPYLCFLEDDVLLEPGFYEYIYDSLHYVNADYNILRLMHWGEGYITSLESAKRTLYFLQRDGVIENIDNQLKDSCGKEIGLNNVPARLMIETNKGDCCKTADLESNFPYA